MHYNCTLSTYQFSHIENILHNFIISIIINNFLKYTNQTVMLQKYVTWSLLRSNQVEDTTIGKVIINIEIRTSSIWTLVSIFQTA